MNFSGVWANKTMCPNSIGFPALPRFRSSSSLGQNSALPPGDIGSLEAEKSLPGFVWVATQFGLALTDGLTWQVYPREMLDLTLNSLGWHIQCAARTGENKMWGGSGRGLYLFDLRAETYQRFTTQNSGLPSDEIAHLEVAPDASVWIATFDSPGRTREV